MPPWKPSFLSQFPWLRTFPCRTQDEWEALPNEAPEYVYCVCCVAFQHSGHKDALTKNTVAVIRSDKMNQHDNPAHKRAWATWKRLHPDEQQQPDGEAGLDEPLS